jgi:cysteinyl-tRNA synthetase
VKLGEFTDGWLRKFQDDCKALNLLKPHVEPSAVAHIPEQIAMIELLIEKGHAYQAADKSVYFKVDSFPEYGRLSHLDKRELKSGAGGTTTDDEYEDKESLTDFALWKTRKDEDGENYWESPWGEGRPGWHLECSAMTLKYLGESFDMHSGGIDLVFPHHENEIAQSECCTGQTFAKHWFHVIHLLVDGRKMSKSLGNLYTLEMLAERGYTAMETRYVLLSGHYRQPLNFTLSSLDGAKQALAKLARAEKMMGESAGNPQVPSYKQFVGMSSDQLGRFAPAWESLNRDINTPEALGKIFSAIKDAGSATAEDYQGFHFMMQALGFQLPAVKEGPSEEAPAEIKALAQQRWDAKNRKDWTEADRLRDEVTAAGWTIKDGKDGFELWPG